MDMIFKNVFLIDDDKGKREWNPNFATYSWSPSPPPLLAMSTKNLGMFYLFKAQVIIMLLVWL
jgi:hypothetical protein